MGPIKFLRRRFLPPVRRAIIRGHKRRGSLLISDTTLRDGEQMPGATLDPEDKLAIAHALARVGVHSLDCGFPASSEADRTAIRMIASEVKGTVLTALARTKPSDIDAAHETLDGLPLQRRGISLFIGTSPLHRSEKLRMSKSEVIRTAVDAVHYASQRFSMISLGAEDASRTEPDFLAEFAREACAAGISSFGIPDTVGIQTPEHVRTQIRDLLDRVPAFDATLLAVHYHNDLGLAVANALAAIQEGATIVQGTFAGIGERAGNMPIEELLLAIACHPDEYGPLEGIDLKSIRPLCEEIATRCGLPVSRQKPVIGRNVFATEAGIHQDGLLKNPATYLPFPSEWVGVDNIELILGRHSGRSAVAHRLAAAGLPADDATIQAVLGRIESLPKGREVDDQMLADFAAGD